MAAVDYARLREQRCRVTGCSSSRTARRSLSRAGATFAHALRDASFGELWVGGKRPSRFEHVFASIQSLNRVRARRRSIPRTSTS